jgi:hypothetical protein
MRRVWRSGDVAIAVVTIGLCLVLAVVAIGLLSPADSDDLWTEAGKVALTAVGVAVIGGLVKFLFDQHAYVRTQLELEIEQKREARAKRDTIIRDLIMELDGLRNSVERARRLIRAHRSARSYRDRMQEIIDTRVRAEGLERKVEALEDSDAGLLEGARHRLISHLEKSNKYLDALIQEYEEKYKPVADLQRLDEETVDATLKAYAEKVTRDGSSQVPDPEFRWRAWEAIKTPGRFPRLLDFLAEENSTYDAEVATDCQAAINELYAALRRNAETSASPLQAST